MPRIVKDPQERKEEIITAARELFKSKGFANTSMQDLMARLSIAKGTIYHYFKSKDDVLEAVVESIVNESLINMQETLNKTNGNALSKFKALAKEGNISVDNKELLAQVHKPENAAMHIRLLAVALLKQSVLYAQVIRQGCEEGLFKTDTPLECAEFMVAAVQFLTDTGIHPWGSDVLARRLSAFPALIERQLSAAPGSFQFLSEI